MLTRRARPTRRVRVALAVTGAVTLAALSACTQASPPAATSSAAAPTASAGSAFPVTVSSCARDFTYDHAPKRVLLGHPNQIGTLDALGVADRVIGYYGPFKGAELPAKFAKLPNVAPGFVASREAIIAARPDFFLPTYDVPITGKGGIGYDGLADLGAGVYVTLGSCGDNPGAQTMEDGLFTDIPALGRIFGVEAKATELVTKLRARVASAAALRGNRPPAKAALISYEASNDKFYVGGASIFNAMFAAAGLENEFADVKAFASEISDEALITRKPDVIFVVYNDEDDGVTAAQQVARVERRLAGSPAVTGKHVIAMRTAYLQGGVISLVDLIEQAARAAYGP